jgi:hypothetical protein
MAVVPEVRQIGDDSQNVIDNDQALANEKVIDDWIVKGLNNDPKLIENVLIVTQNHYSYPLVMTARWSKVRKSLLCVAMKPTCENDCKIVLRVHNEG